MMMAKKKLEIFLNIPPSTGLVGHLVTDVFDEVTLTLPDAKQP